jgi:alpha-beta hydrolase superfamily lysophospholipase
MTDVLFERIQYPCADGENTVSAYVWTPGDIEPRMVVQLCHGMCEYVERYDAWARQFAEQGIVFCGNDHLGHGRTAKCDDDLGYTAPEGGADILVEDAHSLTRLMRKKYPSLPLVLYGHSMGSFVARAYLTRYGNEVDGALISGTAGPGQPTAIALQLTRLIGNTRGMRTRSKLLTALAFGAYNNRYKKENDPASWITRIEDVRKRYSADPWCNYVFTAAGYNTLFTLLDTVSRRDWASKLPKDLPIHLFAGDGDPVGAYGRGVTEVFRRLREAGCNVSMKLYEGGRHEMHNEQNADEVLSDLLAFLSTVTPRANQNI